MTAASKKRLSPAHRTELKKAFATLEESTFAAKLSQLTFGATDRTTKNLPAAIVRLTEKVVGPALTAALSVAVRTLGKNGSDPEGPVARHLHKAMVALSGATGGAAGLPGLIAELPLTTVLMLRRIAEIARKSGEDLSDPAARLACLEVFALSGIGAAPEAVGSTYYAARIALHGTIAQAARELSGAGGKLAGHAFSGLVSKIAAKFGVNATRLAATRVVPVAGAASGAVLNTLFMDHYQELAEAHFTIRRLERQYGADTVRAAYERLRKKKV
ncbi:MAG TPA: EcsC family protein [bacterium]|nr:EcsC family protein [bacterium]